MKLHIEEEDDVSSNDTDLIINEDDIPLSQIQIAAADIEMGDDEDEIPLSQVKNGARVVRYRESLQIDMESDEFSASNNDDIQQQQEVVQEILAELNKSLEKAEMECENKQIEGDAEKAEAEVVKSDSISEGGKGVRETSECGTGVS